MMAIVPAFAEREEGNDAIVFAVVVCSKGGSAEFVAGGVYQGNAVEEDSGAKAESDEVF